MVAAIILIGAVVSFRVIGASFGSESGVAEFMANFSPLAAVFFCGALFLPWKIALAAAFGALLISDMIISAGYAMAAEKGFVEVFLSPHVVVRYLAFGLVFALGCWLQKRRLRSVPVVFGGTLLASVAFYIITNSASWVAEPAYAKSFAGWWQALTTGLPGFPPTWTFFRNSLAGDLFFTALFLLTVQPYASIRRARSDTASLSTLHPS